MFSYLHGIRPSNRRSAIPPPAAFSQTASSRYYHDTVAINSPSDSNLDHPVPQNNQSHSDLSPVSPDPPILPPIPRVASQHEGKKSPEKIVTSQDQDQGSVDLQQKPHEHADAGPALLPSNQQSRFPVDVRDRPNRTPRESEPSHPSTMSQQPQSATTRPKRPIDLAYESMRSYTEGPRRQALGNSSDNALFLQQPQRNPPPPPLPSKSSHHQQPTQPQPQLPLQHIRQAPPPPPHVTARSHIPIAAGHKNHSKAKLNLLNPMSLLARRRSSQAVEEAFTQSQPTPGIQIPDPRIRGNVVHDFSAPRPGRPLSSEANNPAANSRENMSWAEAMQRRSSPSRKPGDAHEDDSNSSVEKEHTPVFKENFDDSAESWSSEMDSPAKRRTSAFMYQVALQASKAPEPSSLPAFARNLPSNVSSGGNNGSTTSTPPKASLEVVHEAPLPNQTPAKPSPPATPPKARSPGASITDSPLHGLGSPQRYKSNASRFSFDLAGVGSAAQEKILEDKHRQKAKQKQRASVLSDDNELEDDDAYADFDDIDDDGLEERIPGVNADADDGVMPSLHQAIDNFGLISPNKSSFESVDSHVSTGLTSPGTPRDIQEQPTGLSTSKSSPSLHELYPVESSSVKKARPRSNPGATMDPGLQVQPLQREAASETDLAGLPRRYDIQDEDDMYFDDGIIEDFDDVEHQAFDESVFDDDTSRVYGLPIRGLKPLANLSVQDLVSDKQHDSGELSSTIPPLSSDEDHVGEMKDSVTNLNHPALVPKGSRTAGLTHDNLGLHDRLAFAANKAALEGKFHRTYSHSSTHESYDGQDSSRGTTTQEKQINVATNGLGLVRDMDTNNDFTFDDTEVAFDEAENDDPIIAAANAEALENDDDGFYGQEFGFFARKSSSGSNNSEYVNGGYFGPRAIESIHRMNSGRDNFQEPSLTPITERSEWSNRNSTISLAMHGYPLSAQYQSNPQLADLMRVQEGEELSMEALKKLRRGAWGSSEVSLQSSSNSQTGGSPLTYFPPGLSAPLMQHSNSNGSLLSPSSQNLAGSFHSFGSNGVNSSNDSEHSPSGDSPTITLAVPQLVPSLQSPPMPMGPPPPPPIDAPSTKRNSSSSKTWAPGHSRNSSGAESVSYREENGRWFCERTRIDEETGEVEVLGRTVIEGGRI